MMISSALKIGDTIGIVAPSKAFKSEQKFELDNFIKYIEHIGLKVKISDYFYEKDFFLTSSGTPVQRASDINAMFADPEIHAIWCLQGGEVANQVLPYLDYELIKKNPKIFIGKSDIDVLLLAIYKNTGLITFHACDSKIGGNKELDFDYTKKYLEKRLFLKSKIIEPSNTEIWQCLSLGKATGRIIGCNITCMLKLAGTKYFPDFSDVIFFIETFKSEPGEILFQLTQLEQLGVFQKINGVVIGSNCGFQSDKFKAEEIIVRFLRDYNLPILKINEFGHYQPHAFLPIGCKVALDASNKKIEIIDDFLL